MSDNLLAFLMICFALVVAFCMAFLVIEQRFPVHLIHRWQGMEVSGTKIFKPGATRPERIVYHQWFECQVCKAQKRTYIGEVE